MTDRDRETEQRRGRRGRRGRRREPCHRRLALVHVAHHHHLADGRAADLHRLQGDRDHAENLPSFIEHRVRHFPHQADGTSAVHETDAPVGDLFAQLRGFGQELRRVAGG